MKGDARPIDLLLVGGGLANALIAYRLRVVRPDLHVLVVESGSQFGGNHTWSFHETDLTPEQRNWTSPFVLRRWPNYAVSFPGLSRTLALGYASATSDRLHAVLEMAGLPVVFGAEVVEVSPTQARLKDGRVLQARAVVDGRGPTDMPHLRLGWQKFYGQEIVTARPHGLAAPILMDATVEQHDGYRFVYVLPFAPDRLLIEDTYYSDTPDLCRETLGRRIEAYAADRGWTRSAIVRDESGVLPITLAGDVGAFWRAKAGQPCAGLRAGLFHPTTGFSWPDAIRLADHLSQLPDLAAAPLFDALRRFALARWREQAFFRALDRMLFLAGPPDRRWQVMQRFYRLNEPLIARFYAGHLRLDDKVRLLVGKPPVPIGGAIKALAAGMPA